MAEKGRAKYRKHRDKILAQQKEYRKTHPSYRNEDYRAKKVAMPWYSMIRGAKQRSEKRNLPFDLSIEWAEENWTGKCSMTGLDFLIGKDWIAHPRSPSIDRIDPAKGYTQSNCRFICFAANALKGRGTDADMLAIAKAIVENFNP